MMNYFAITVHPHAQTRLAQRFGLSTKWLLERIDNNSFVWLDVVSEMNCTKAARGAFLLYIPTQNKFFVAVVDVAAKLIITVLNEDMALRSTWAACLTSDRKKHAKLLALQSEELSGVEYYIQLKQLDISRNTRIVAQCLTPELKPLNITLAKIQVTIDQFLTSELIRLTEDLQQLINTKLTSAVEKEEILPCVDIFARYKDFRTLRVQHNFCNFLSCQELLMRQRWELL